MTPNTPQGWRKQLQKELDQKIPEAVWKRAIERGYIDTANDEESIEKGAGLRFLMEEVGLLLDDYEAYSSSPKLPASKKQHEDSPPVEIKPKRRFQALTDIITTLANRDEDVRKFRDEVLGGNCYYPKKWKSGL